MAGSSLSIVIAAACLLQIVNAACDHAVVDKIMSIRSGISDNLEDDLVGTYTFQYVKYSLGEKVEDDCLVANYTGDSISYRGSVSANFGLSYKDGVVSFLDEDGDAVWTSFVVLFDEPTKTVTLYTCSDYDDDTFSGVAVQDSALKTADTAKRVEEGKAALAQIGVTDGSVPPACSKTSDPVILGTGI